MRACKKSVPYDPIWPRLAPLALCATVCPVKHFLALFGPVWPRLAPFDPVQHPLTLFGPAWTHLALLGHSSILVSICQGVVKTIKIREALDSSPVCYNCDNLSLSPMAYWFLTCHLQKVGHTLRYPWFLVSIIIIYNFLGCETVKKHEEETKNSVSAILSGLDKEAATWEKIKTLLFKLRSNLVGSSSYYTHTHY